MKVAYWALLGLSLNCVSHLFFGYYLVTYYEPDADPNYIVDTVIRVLLITGISLGAAGIIWLFKKSSYLKKFYWSLLYVSLAFTGTNLFATYLMHWSVNR